MSHGYYFINAPPFCIPEQQRKRGCCGEVQTHGNFTHHVFWKTNLLEDQDQGLGRESNAYLQMAQLLKKAAHCLQPGEFPHRQYVYVLSQVRQERRLGPSLRGCSPSLVPHSLPHSAATHPQTVLGHSLQCDNPSPLLPQCKMLGKSLSSAGFQDIIRISRSIYVLT